MRFLLFQLPGEKQVKCIKHKEGLKTLASFFPFDAKREAFHLASQDIEILTGNEILSLWHGVNFSSKSEKIHFPTQSEYIHKVETAIKIVEKNKWQKLVISRPKKISVKIDLLKTFHNLCELFPQTFCYLWKDEQQIWIGATPELLGKFNKETSTFETMSLAGTLPIEQNWTEKEIEEQSAVSQYIYSVLSKFSDAVDVSEVYDYILGKIKHLRTDFRLNIQIQYLNSLIKTLHPTPAVCGIPKDGCKKEILAIESYDRAFYSGYIKVETPTDIYFFVNLRCMQVFDNELIVYVGGGITNKSNPLKEWQETELKSHMIMDNLELI